MQNNLEIEMWKHEVRANVRKGEHAAVRKASNQHENYSQALRSGRTCSCFENQAF